MAQPAPPQPPLRRPSTAPRDVVDDTPFPVPSLYFKVNDSEKDEPGSKVRQDVLKLYERWESLHGRKWPENGLNTEDIVWLAEESRKSKDVVGSSSSSRSGPSAGGEAERRGLPRNIRIPLEDSEVTDHIKDTTDEEIAATAAEVLEAAGGAASLDGVEDATAGQAASTSGAGMSAGSAAAERRARRPKLSNYEKTIAGAKWVTDEFESEDYEAGNMEQLWDTYLWDREGKPTIMPDEPPNPQEGEESEAWDDFYSAYRPRHVDSEEARQAVWVTDEFESDEDNTESEWQPEYVGAGLGLEAEDPLNPQYSLRHSNHPLAPFPGEALKWNSLMYDDGTSYEGLTREDIFHGMGVLVFGNGTGGGFHFKDVRRGDKYEGEFQGGYAHGLGQFTSEARGEIYIGEYFAGQRHGCGLQVNMKPFYYLLERGEQPAEAFQKTYDQIMRNIEFRTWYRNRPLGSDYEDEMVLHPVFEDLGNPFDVILKNTAHESKLREWKGKSSADKVVSKMADIIENVTDERIAKREASLGEGNGQQGYFYKDDDGQLHNVLDSYGEDTEHDSIDLLVGHDTDGMPGPGWRDDPADSELQWDETLLEIAAGDAMEDKMDEDDDKEAVLGDDILNPMTGLSLKEYLDGGESKHRELIVQAFGDDPNYGGYAQQYGLESTLAAAASDSGNRQQRNVLSSISRMLGFGRNVNGSGDDHSGGGVKLSAAEEYQLSKALNRAEKAEAEDDPYALPNRFANTNRNPFSEDTDTRFETESDQMELCDLAEILGTVDEAEEIVTRARMWRWKPAGEVTIRTAMDANGSPVELMQDPLHYPHGTKFMAPGPLGQCHPLPDDEAIRDAMLKVAHNYEHIHSLYNFDWDPEPGSVQYAIAQRIERAEELRQQQLGRMERLADEVAAAETAQSPELRGELLASASAGMAGTSVPGGKQLLVRNGSAFASISFGMSRGSCAVWDTLARAARRLPPPRRPRLLQGVPSATRERASSASSHGLGKPTVHREA